jgi:hypothetical protein
MKPEIRTMRFDSGSCHHFPVATEIVGDKTLNSACCPAKTECESEVAYLNYRPNYGSAKDLAEKDEKISSKLNAPSSVPFRLTPPTVYRAIRSKPVQLKRVFWRKLGKFAFRVTGTIRGRQRCALKLDPDEAQAIADAWESERLNNHVAIRARATRLNQSQLSESEAIIEMYTSQGVSPLSAVLVGLNHASAKTSKKLLSEALTEFLSEKEKTFPHLSWKITAFAERASPKPSLKNATWRRSRPKKSPHGPIRWERSKTRRGIPIG